MISQREVERQYSQLTQDVATNDYYKPDPSSVINNYVCPSCQHITKTKSVDVGVIPMMFDCEKCGKQAKSTFFKDWRPAQEPTIEWYRPTLQEVLKMRNKPWELEHILKGGLKHRKCLTEPSKSNP